MAPTRRSLLVLATIVAAVVAAAGVGSATVVTANGTDDATDKAVNATETTVGEEVSTFLQSSTADAGESVTTGMFVAGYEDGDAERRRDAVDERTAELTEKLDALETDRDRLAERAEASSLAYTARLTRLEAEIEALERAIAELEPRADAVDTETKTVMELRAETEDLAESNLSVSGAELAN